MKTPCDFLYGVSVGQIGSINADNPFVALTDPDNGLSDYCAVFTPDNKPDSISDIIGHAIYCYNVYKDKNHPDYENKKAEWRGMLSEIFFTGLIGGANSVYTCPVNKDEKANSDLVNFIKDRMVFHRRITGIDEDCDEFKFYQKNNHCFAMILPGFVILPFCNYDKKLFENSNFVDNNGNWSNDNIISYFSSNIKHAKLFIEYLVNLRVSIDGNYIGRSLINEFIDDLKKVVRVFEDDYTEPAATSETSGLTPLLETGIAHKIPELRGAYFTDKLLGFRSPYDTADSSDNTADNNVGDDIWADYKVDHYGQLLTPIGLQNFCGEERNPVYVVPPFNKEFLQSIEKGDIEFKGWKVELSNEDDSAVVASINFILKENNSEITLKHTFSRAQIVIAKELPDISLWPYVNDPTGNLWNEYFVGVSYADFNGRAIVEYPEIDALTDEGKLASADKEEIKVGTFVDAEDYEVKTSPFGVQNDPYADYKILKSSAFPEYITLSYDGMVIGCWQVDKSKAGQLRTVQDKHSIVGLDFASTSSVVVLYDVRNQQVSELDGPGTYLYNIFNPLFRPIGNADREDKEDDWKFFQDYYMFGSNKKPINKIYSYGQALTAENADGPCLTHGNYITSRPLIVSSRYIKSSIDGTVATDSDIYSGLKWPAKKEDLTVTDRISTARTGFITGLLTWALLKSRLLGFDSVEIRVSYPKKDHGDLVCRTVKAQKDYLQTVSGYQNLTIYAAREAEANAYYLLKGLSKGWHDIRPANPSYSYMLGDIGGVTTDLGVLQYDDLDAHFDDKLKAESSFKYAGRELVDIPLLQSKDFSRMWNSREIDLSDILSDYSPLGSLMPESDQTPAVEKKISTVGFLLDHATLADSFRGNNIGHIFDKIKYKYLALSWLFGRYIRKLNDKKVIKVDTGKPFVIYLTGCASKGIDYFCTQNDPDFVSKCGKIASWAYFKAGENPESFITIQPIARDSKKEVAWGLTQIEHCDDVQPKAVEAEDFCVVPDFETQNNIVISDEVIPTTETGDLDDYKSAFNKDEVYASFMNLMYWLNYISGETWTHDRIEETYHDEIEDYCCNPVYVNDISKRLTDSLIFNDLYAMYILEMLLDDNKPVSDFM